jgi:hypothetical protein
MSDFSAVDGGDEAISNRTDHLIEVWLGGEDVDCSLQRDRSVIGCQLGDGGGVGDGVERNGETRRGRRSGGGRLIGEVD